MRTYIRGANGDTPAAAVDMAYHEAILSAEINPLITDAGNPVLTGTITAMSVIQIDSNPTVPMAGKRWYEAVVAVAFKTVRDDERPTVEAKSTDAIRDKLVLALQGVASKLPQSANQELLSLIAEAEGVATTEVARRIYPPGTYIEDDSIEHEHFCDCLGFGRGIGHVVGAHRCFRFMTAKPKLLEDGTWETHEGVFSDKVLRKQRGYRQHPCGCWSRLLSDQIGDQN